MNQTNRKSAFLTTLAILLFCAPLVYAITVPSVPDNLYGYWVPASEWMYIEWDENPSGENVDKYGIQRADGLDGEFFTLSEKINPTGTGLIVYYDDTIDPEGEEDYFRYRVRAHNASGWGDYTGEDELVIILPEKK